MKEQLTEGDFLRAARKLGCDVAAIKAVAEVESRGSGFLPSGEVRILFEAHVFDAKTGGRYRKSHPNLSSARWNKALYGAGGQHQHARLQRAVALDRNAALEATSWGRFQVMGFNWKTCGYPSLQAFITAMHRSEADHLDAFVRYVLARGLADELRRLDFAGFALGYNGEGYKANRYDEKMVKAYARYAKGANFSRVTSRVTSTERTAR